MLDPNFFENLSKKLSDLIPSNLQVLREDFEKNIHSTLQSVFSKLDLITREEFDVHLRLLQKAQEKISFLEEKINALEKEHSLVKNLLDNERETK